MSALIRGGLLVDEITRTLIAELMKDSLDDVAKKERLCASLGIRSAAVSNEGFVIHSPPRGLLVDVLRGLDSIQLSERRNRSSWQFVSSHEETLSAFAEIGADAVTPAVANVEYLDLRAAN